MGFFKDHGGCWVDNSLEESEGSGRAAESLILPSTQETGVSRTHLAPPTSPSCLFLESALGSPTYLVPTLYNLVPTTL